LWCIKLLALWEPQQQSAFLACQQAWVVGEGAELLWPLLAASHAPPPDKQGIQADTKPPVLLIAEALPFCATYHQVHQKVSFDPFFLIKIWMLREVLIKVISKQILNSEDPQ